MKTKYLILFIGLLCCASCQKWDLERIDFPQLGQIEIQQTSLSTIEISGNLDGLRNGQVTELGFLWSTIDEMPAINLVNTSRQNLGASFSNDSFSYTIEGLNINTDYYVRAYAIYDNDPIYSEVVVHRVNANLLVEHLGVNGILRSQKAIATAKVTGLPFGKTIEKFGHCWSTTNPVPTIADFSLNQGNSTFDTTYVSELGNLEFGTTYYIRPFIIVDGVERYGDIEAYVKGDFWLKKNDTPHKDFIYATTFEIGKKGYALSNYSNLNANNIQELWEYDLAMDTWTLKLEFPGEPRKRAIGFSLNGKGYVGYGERSNTDGYAQDLWEYDPNDLSNGVDENGNPRGKFILKDSPYPGEERSRASVFEAGGRVFYGWGIYNIYQSDEVLYKDVWEYLPDDTTYGIDENGNPNGRWEKRADYPGTPRFGIEGVGYNGKVYVFFGDTHEGNTQQRLEAYVYDPTTNIWTQKMSAPQRGRTNANVFLIRDVVYIGLGNFQQENDFWQFDLLDINNGLDINNEPLGFWNEISEFAGGPRVGSIHFQFEDRGFVFGGFPAGSSVAGEYEMWEYIADN